MIQADDDIQIENELVELNIVESANKFSFSFFKHLMEENPGGLISSPMSAAAALAMVGCGAGGVTGDQFKKVLNLPTPSDCVVYSAYQKLIETVHHIKENKIFFASKLFINEERPVNLTYEQLSQSYCCSSTQCVDFRKNNEAAEIINAWVNQNTDNLLKGLTSGSGLSKNTSMILVNAIYFKGKWQNKFDTKFTEAMPGNLFHVTKDTSKNVPMMFCNCECMYGQLLDMDAKFVEIPYKGGELSMVIIVPNEIDGLAKIEARLDKSLASILEHGHQRQMDLYLPKFKTESEIELSSVLKKMGLTNAFEDSANFLGISDGPLKISHVVQKAFIEVNEEGGEPAPTRVEVIAKTIICPCPVFKVDRPSYYAVYHNESSVLLFNGLIAF